MKKKYLLRIGTAVLLAAVLTVTVFASIPLGQSSDGGWGVSMSSSIDHGFSSAYMSGTSNQDIFVSVGCNVYYESGYYDSGSDSIVFPEDGPYCAVNVSITRSDYEKTRGMNLFQPYDDSGTDYCGTYLEIVG